MPRSSPCLSSYVRGRVRVTRRHPSKVAANAWLAQQVGKGGGSVVTEGPIVTEWFEARLRETIACLKALPPSPLPATELPPGKLFEFTFSFGKADASATG